MTYIKTLKHSSDLRNFLTDQIAKLNSKSKEGKRKEIENLPIEKQVLLIHLMYIGREENDNSDFYKNNFYSNYEDSYEQWRNDKCLVEQMTSKIPFMDYLENAKNKYSEDFDLK